MSARVLGRAARRVARAVVLARARHRFVRIVAAFAFATATSALVAPADAADSPLSSQQQQGQKLFRGTCFYCHSEKVWGTLSLERRRPAGDALLEKRTDLTPDFVRTVVRNGVGSMPAYRRTELNDAEVNAIIAYLTRGSSPGR